MTLISGFIVLSLLITFAYLIGILTFLTDNEKNRCEMTYMYEYPQFVKINFNMEEELEKYGLYAYSEGRFTENSRNMKFSGIPVLFIPGNAGSFKQVRSFASVALRMSLNLRPGFHFDFFAVDLNEEFSGLNGVLLYEQTKYINRSIEKILQLYGNSQSTKSIVILGHSMGGIIARGILNVLPNKNIIPLIITLASPHARPSLMLDPFMDDYYHRIQSNNTLVNNTIIAVSGGYNDYLMTPFIAAFQNNQQFHVMSTSIPLVWLPIDHLCILWCKQLVLAVTRGLFEVVDVHSKQITPDPGFHLKVFHHYLIRNNGLKFRKSNQYSLPVPFSKGRSEWIENLQKHYTISLKNGANQVQWHMIRLLNDVDYRSLTIVAINLEVMDWVFACCASHVQGQQRICTEGIHLSHLSEIAPSAHKKRRILHIDTHELKRNYSDITHIVIRVLPTSNNVVLHIDRYLDTSRTFQVNLPSLLSLKCEAIINKTQEKIVHYKLMLPQLQHIMQSLKLYVEPIKCTVPDQHAAISLIVPWGNQNIHKYVVKDDQTPLHVRLHLSRPLDLNDSAFILLTLDQSCRYSVSIKNDILGVLSQLVRSYSPLLLSNMVAIVILSLRNQLDSVEKTGTCSIFFTAIQHGIKPYYVLPIVKIISRGLSYKNSSRHVPVPDWYIITEEGNDFLLLPLLLYMTSVGVIWLTALAIAISIIFCESSLHKLMAKFLARTVTGSTKLSDLLSAGFYKLPEIVASVLIILCITTCGGLSLCLGCVFYFLKLTQMSQDYVEQLVLNIFKYFVKKFKKDTKSQTTDMEQSESSQNNIVLDNDEKSNTMDDKESDDISSERKECVRVIEQLASGSETVENNSEDNNGTHDDLKDQKENDVADKKEVNCDGIHFHFTIFILWCMTAALNIPSVLTWAHNFKYSTVLISDTSFIPGLILSLCALPLWHMDLPRKNVYGYPQLRQFLYIMALMSLICATVFLYRLNYVITLTILTVTLHQAFSPKLIVTEAGDDDNNTTDTETPETLYNDVKAKWE
ncbi:hypothetical protein FQA39_LY03243 [Lamprigera yunnana]|nr:hypothetical protein FQA39_LY03243 [Lamprigera yunnana]